jgi:hypothetical protein
MWLFLKVAFKSHLFPISVLESEPQKSATTMDAIGGSGIIDSVNNMMLAGEMRGLKSELLKVKRENEKLKMAAETKTIKAPQLE